MNDEVKLTPEEWCLRTGIQVMDPDGWNRRDFDVSWNNPITRGEFLVKAASSTCMAWPKPLYDDKWMEEKMEDKIEKVDPVSSLLEAAIAMHEMFVTLVQAGFTEKQALIMVAEILKNAGG